MALVDAKLDRLEQKLDRIQSSVPGMQEASSEDKKEQSVMLTTGIIALAGAKLFALLGGKIGFIKGIMEHGLSWSSASKSPKANDPNFNKINAVLYTSFVWAGLSAIAGTIIGAVIGFTRGDRLEDPKMLWKHPSKSLKLLFGKAPPPKPDDRQPAGSASIQGSWPTIQDSGKSWQAAEVARPVQSAEAGLAR